MNNIKSLNLEIIDICNLKCNICDIWKNKSTKLLEITDINNILSSKYINKNTDITITGWEPLLHNNITNIFKNIYEKWYTVNTLSTNWILTIKLMHLLFFCDKNKIPLPNIHISIDWNKEIHDSQRWMKWSFNKSLETIIKLKKEYSNINIKIKYTITKNNIFDIETIYKLSKKLWIEISFKIVEDDSNYTNNIASPILLNNVEKKQIIQIFKKIYNNDLYINHLIYYLDTEKLKFKCNTPKNILFILANWKIFSCTKYDEIGNIKESSIDEIIYNHKHMSIINLVEKNNCNKCFSLHWSYNTLKLIK